MTTEGTQEPSFVTLSQIGDSLGEAQIQPTSIIVLFSTMNVDRKMTENDMILNS